ncbi:hypothetical protein P280DRAFT_479978 [Massarina eburnea CBS 473.64]|uniref:Uncharacterized protein n=1 Tax=Massarina eburnea CBS 473.64 TaxID=1395130 RepID=A0A6A6S3C8_9PLEO|nr:hypothetical protein P280DRAFT_479978 [Massarina eburnea CBS 473.64]
MSSTSPPETFYEALSCNDILTTIHNAVNSRTNSFDTAVIAYKRTFESMDTATSVPEVEALAIECHLLLDKIDDLLTGQKTLLESLDAGVLARLLSRSMEVGEGVARRIVESRLECVWEGYWDAFCASCVEERRGDVDGEVEFVVRKIRGKGEGGEKMVMKQEPRISSATQDVVQDDGENVGVELVRDGIGV